MSAYAFQKAVNFIILVLALSLCSGFPVFAQENRPQAPMKIVFAMGYQPFSWQDGNGKPMGVLIVSSEEIFEKRLKIPVELMVYPWKRAQNMVKTGEADAMITIPTSERAEYAITIRPAVIKSEFRIFIGAENPKTSLIANARHLGDLKNIPSLSTGFLTGSGWHLENLGAFPNIMTAAKLSEILKMVDAQRLDVYIDSALIVDYHLMEQGLLGRVIPVGNVMETPQWHLMIGKLSPYASMAGEISKKLKTISDSGELSHITRDAVSRFIKIEGEIPTQKISILKERQP